MKAQRSWLASAVLASAVAVCLVKPSRADITYDVNLAVGTGTAVGFITTDGTTGIFLGNQNIVAYDLVLTNGSFSHEFNSLVDPFQIQGIALTATASALFFNFSHTTGSFFELGDALGFEDAKGFLSNHPSTISFNLSCCGD